MFQKPYYGLDPIWEKITPIFQVGLEPIEEKLTSGPWPGVNIKDTLNPYKRSEDESVASFRLSDC